MTFWALRLRLTAWLITLVATLTTLHKIGPSSQPLGGSNPWSLEQWDHVDPVALAFGGARWMALGVGWYLCAVTVIALLSRCTICRGFTKLADACTLPFVRTLVHSALSAGTVVSLSIGPSVAASAQDAAQPPTPALVMVLLDPSDAAPATDAPIMRVVDPHGAVTLDEALPASDDPTEWRVAPGDHFWAMAMTNLQRTWGRAPSVTETATYWERVVAANADRLVVPGEPDLIFAGQDFVMPSVPPRTT